MWEAKFKEPSSTRSTQKTREYRRHHIGYVSSNRMPETDIQALMEAPPHTDPETSLESSEHLREVLADAIDQLEPRLKWIFEARHYEGMSIRQIGLQLNLTKSYIDRLYRRAVEQLADILKTTGIG